MAEKTSYNLRSIMAMAWVYARIAVAKSGGSVRQHLSASLKQAWSEEKAEMARKAAKAACWEREHRAAAAVRAVVEADAEARRLAGVNTAYRYSWARGVRSGRFQ